MRLGSLVLTSLLLMATAGPVSAGAEAQNTSAERPARGMTMNAVESRYGAPTKRMPAVGTPPITRWEYPGFVVYFEYDHVVHSVVDKE